MNLLSHVSWSTWKVISQKQMTFSYITREKDMYKFTVMRLWQTVAPYFFKDTISNIIFTAPRNGSQWIYILLNVCYCRIFHYYNLFFANKIDKHYYLIVAMSFNFLYTNEIEHPLMCFWPYIYPHFILFF